MKEPSLPDVTGAKNLISGAFSAVFDELNYSTEAWFQKSKLLTLGRENYAEYMARRVGVFSLFATSRFTTVDSAFVKVEVSPNLERERYKSLSDIEGVIRQQKEGEVGRQKASAREPLDALDSTSNGFALLGHPGSGKTTILRHLAMQAARGCGIQGRSVIPIYLPLRDFASPSETIWGASVAFLEWLEIKESDRVLRGLLSSGRGMLLLDGLDEVPKEHQRTVLAELLDLRAKYSNSIYCVSSRPASLDVGLPGFTKWETLPFLFEERIAFVEKWFAAVDPAKGKRLLETCQTTPGLLDLGSSPLLLSIVCALYFNDLDIPTDTDELYARATEGMLGGWDSFRNILRYSKLGHLSLKKRIVLVGLIASSLFESGKIAFSSKDLDVALAGKNAERRLRVELPSSEVILHSLADDFGLLVERAPRVFSFSHLTFQEYLTARHTVESRSEVKFVVQNHQDEASFQVIVLIAKILPNADEFMSTLSKKTQLHEPNQVGLLRAVWESKPICSPKLAVKLIASLAKRMFEVLRKVDSTFRFEDSVLWVRPHRIENLRSLESSAREARKIIRNNIKVRRQSKRAAKRAKKGKFREDDAIAAWLILLECLPDLIQILNSSGFTDDELGITDSRLLALIQGAEEEGLDRVQIIEAFPEKDGEDVQPETELQ